jgi:uncharacterized repeat protein (TIGR01451 family)
MVAFALAVVVAVTIVLFPGAAPAAAGTMTTSALGARVYIGLLNGALPIDLQLPLRQSWTSGGNASSDATLVVDLLPPLIPNLIYVGAISAGAAPTTGGGRADSQVAGLKLLNSTIAVDALGASCQMTSTGITTNVTVTNLKLTGQSILNPAVNLAIGVPGVLTATVNKRVATWDPATGRLDYTVRALDIDLLSGLAVVASGSVVAGEATCSGIVKLGTATTTAASVAPGQSGVPVVTVTNTGDIAAPGTTIKIPKPPSAYTLDPPPTVTGGGTCSTTDPALVICSGATVPGGGNVQVSLPVKLPATTPGTAPNWVASPGDISVTSTPIAGSAASMTITGSGTLVNGLPRSSTGGSVTVNPMILYAGKTASTDVTVSNQGPSDAAATVAIPLGARPSGVTVTASAGGTPCTVGASDVVCTGVTVPAGGSAPVTVTASAPVSVTVGTTWDLTGVTADLNGIVVPGNGRLLTIGDPDVYLKTVTLDPATATPGGAQVTAGIRVANAGVLPATGTTISIPAAPAGYTVGPVTTSGGGTCTASGCTGVTVPANGTVTVSMPAGLGAGVTANWTGTATATAGSSTATATGTLVTATPHHALHLTATGPSPGTVLPGQTTTMALDVDNLGPSNAVQATFDVFAPAHATWGSLTGNPCTALTASTARCTVDLTAGGPATALSFPLVVSPPADPAAPLTGGCADLDLDGTCDTTLPDITLRTPLSALLTTVATPATITPGQSGTAKVTLTSLAGRTGVQATIPKTALPAGFTVTSASVPGGTCTNAAGAVSCTGFPLVAATPKDVTLQIAVASNVTPPRVWAVPDIAVTAAGETVGGTGTLAAAGPVSTGLGATADQPADRTIEPGGTVDLGLDLRNTGPSDAPAAIFTVAAPAGTSFGAAAGPCTTTAVLLTCTTSLPAGSSTGRFTVPLHVAANADPDIPIAATCVDLDGTPGCGAGDVAVPAVNLKVPFAARAAFTVTAADVTPGDSAVATVRVTAPRDNLTGLRVAVPLAGLPGALTVTGVTGPAGATCGISGGYAECSGFTLTGGHAADIALTVAAPAAATGTATWSVTGISASSGGESLAVNRDLARLAAAHSVLTATVRTPANEILPGDTGDVEVTVDNTGPSDADDAVVTAVAPLGASFGTAPAGCTRTDATHVTCTLDLTVAAAPVVYTIPLVVDPTAAPGSALTGGCVQLAAVCATTIPAIPVGTPLHRRLTVSTDPATIVPGTTGTARIDLASTTAEHDLTVTVATALPAGLAVTGVSVPGGTCTTTIPITCSHVDLPTTGIVVALSAHPSAPPAAWSIAVDVRDGTDPAAAVGTLATVASPHSRLTVVSADGPADGVARLGGTAGVDVTVRNDGPSDATARAVTATAPIGTTFDGTSLPGGCTATLPALVTCAITLAGGASTTLSLPVLIPTTVDPLIALTGGCVTAFGTPGCTAIRDIVLEVPLDRRATITTAPVPITPGTTENVDVTVGGTLTGVTLAVPLPPAGFTLGTVTSNGASCTTTATAVECTWASTSLGRITLPITVPASATPGTTWTATGIRAADSTGDLVVNRALATVDTARTALAATVVALAPILPGGTGTLTFTLANTGPSDATTAPIGVILPADATFGTLPAGCPTGTPDRTTCPVTVPAGAAAASGPSLPIAVSATADPTGPLTGGCVDLDDDGTCTAGDEPFAVPLEMPFDRRVTVQTAPVTATGDATIVVVSAPSVNDMRVVVPLGGLPAGITAGAGPGCTADATAITCDDVDVGATLTVPVTIAASAPAGHIWAPQITVSGPGSGSITVGGILASVGTPPYDLGVSVPVPAAGAALRGDRVDLAATVVNVGGAVPGLDVPVTVRAPTGTTFGALGATTDTDCDRTSPTTLTCAVGVGSAGTVATWTLPVVIAVAPASATVTGGCFDLDGDGACETPISDFVLGDAMASVISVLGSAPATVTPGDTGRATLTLHATDARDRTTVTLDTSGLPTGLSVTAAALDGTPCTVAASAVSCAAWAGGDLSVTVAAAADATEGDTWTPAVTVDRLGDNTRLTRLFATVGVPDTPLTVDVDPPADDTVLPGGVADVRVTLHNTGVSLLRAGSVVVTAPGGTAVTGTTCPRDSAVQVTCAPRIAAGGSATLTIQLTVGAAASPGARLSGGCVDPGASGTCAATIDFTLATTLAQRAVLSLDPALVVPGDVATAYVEVTADRPFSALAAAVPLAGLPAGLEVVGAAGPAGSTCDLTGPITCTGISVPAGTGHLLALRVRAGAALPAGVAWSPAVTVSEPGGDTTRAAAVLARTLAPIPDLRWELAGPPGTVAPGDTTSVRMTVHNDGISDAAGVAVRVLAPADATFGGPLDPSCVAVGDARLDCTLLAAAGAAPLDLVLPVRIPAAAVPGSTITGGCVDISADGVCDEVLPAIHVTPALLRSVTADTATITPGSSATVTLRVDTTAAAPTVTIPLTDLPAGMTVTPPGSCATVHDQISCVGTTIALDTAVADDASPASWSPAVTVADAGRSAQAVVAVARIGAARIGTTVGVTGPAAATIRPGGTGTFTVTVANAGPSRAVGWSYSVVAPSGITLAPAASCTPQGDGARLDCTADIAPGARVRIPLAFTVSPAAGPANPITGGCVLEGATCTPIPDLSLATPISVTVRPGSTAPGNAATAVLAVTGSAAQATVTVPLDTLPPGFAVTDASCTGAGCAASGTACAVSAAEIRCTGVGLPATVSVTVRTAPGVAPGAAWRAAVTAIAGDETTTRTADLITTTARVAAVRYKLSNAAGRVTPGDETALTVTATNGGPSHAVRKSALLTAPEGTRLGSLTGRAAQDCTEAGTTTLTCTFDLDRDAELTWTIPLVVSTAASGKLAGACLVADGTNTCGDEVGIAPSIARTGTLTVPGTVIKAGATGDATIRISATIAHPNLTLTVPLDALPHGITVNSATVGDTTCPIATAITCTGLALAAGTPRELRLSVTVAADVATGKTWQATGITLANDSDRLTAAGIPVSTAAGITTRSVTIGTPTTKAPASGQTTVLPISLAGTGTYEATIVLPDNTTPGTLPDGCRQGATTSVVICDLNLPTRIDLPVVIPRGTDPGKKLVGGCIDAALGTAPNGRCDDDADVPIPPLVVGRHAVNLAVSQTTPSNSLTKDKPLLVRIPYANEGTQAAKDVRFTVRPPAGVTVQSAATMLNATAASTVKASSSVAARCTTRSGAVTCEVPDAAALRRSELWLTLATTGHTKSGNQTMTVAVTTSSTDGNATDNSAAISLTLTAAGDDDGNLAVTGAQVTGLATLAVLIMAVGVTLVAGAPPRRHPRHAHTHRTRRH